MAKDTPLTDAAIRERLAALPGWRYDGGMIRRTYKTDGWPTTLMLVNAIGFIAETADHHPDLLVQWGSVQVSLATHSAGGITEKDFALAQQVERTALLSPGPPFRPAAKFKREGG
jgi:4a-hydroxytetrahydrobiopterin dehydratase